MPSAATSAGEATTSTRPAPPRRSAWVVTLYYTHGWEQGAHLRTFAVAREWVRRGGEVHFIALRFDNTNPALPQPYLERLRDEGVITGFDQIHLRHPQLRGKLARGALHPAARNVIMGPERRAMTAELDAIARRVEPDAFVFTDRHLLFAAPHLRQYAPVTVDWKDSLHLQSARGFRDAARRRDWRTAADDLFSSWDAGLTERYYASRVDHSVFVSPVDAADMAHALGSAEKVHVIPNGIRDRPTPSAVPRDPDRLIFTGAMDFPPNHHSATWFIGHVLPRVVARRPAVKFVVAGSNPRPELRALAGPNVEVTGWVDDMRAELARSALYVAPMTSGSGFKNKVVEALATGTNVVGTAYAFEFLPDTLRTLFTAANDPDRLADAVLAALDDPSGNEQTVDRFWQLARDEYDWAHVADRFAAAVQPAAAQRS